MRRALILLSVSIILLVAAANVYRDPRVQDLFRSAPRAGSRRPIKPTAAPAAPEQAARPGRAPVPAPSEKKRGPSLERGVESSPVNQVPNETVSRILMQVLAAKGLARGISLEVSGQSIEVFGEVDSNEKRDAIISLIEKGRESRQLDATGLTVQR